MDDAVLLLEETAGDDCARGAADAAIPLPNREPDDQVGSAGFVLDGHERDSLGGGRALAHENQAGDSIAPAGLQFLECGCRNDVLRFQELAERTQGMAPEREPLGMIVMNDFLCGRKEWKLGWRIFREIGEQGL